MKTFSVIKKISVYKYGRGSQPQNPLLLLFLRIKKQRYAITVFYLFGFIIV